MTVRLPSNLMTRPAEEAARILALSYLRQIERDQTRLANPEDLEALHDFRVGIRRFRSCIRAYRPQLKDSLNRKTEQSLRKLMRETNAGRDTEVQLKWLRNQGDRIQPEDTQGLFWLIGRLEGRKLETLDPVTAKISGQFRKTAAKLRRRLSILRVEIEPGSRRRDSSFGQVTEEAIEQHVTRLDKDLKQIVDGTDVKQAHRTRVSMKRLRYLLEPVARWNPRSRDLIGRLKEAQDRLGELHDMHILSGEIAAAVEALAKSHPDEQSARGLRTMERLAREQGDAAFGRFDASWGGGRANRILARANEIGRSLMEESFSAGNGVRPLGVPESPPPEAKALPGGVHVNTEHAV
jgi:CHAD domain-containing protein